MIVQVAAASKVCITTATIEIHPLSPARLADFMAFFEGEAFSDNPKSRRGLTNR